MADDAEPTPKLTVAQRHLWKHQALTAAAADIAAAPPPAEQPRAKPTATQAGSPADLPPPSRQLTVAQRHLLKQQALAAAKAAGETESGASAPPRDDNAPGATEYELLRAQLGNDLREISDQPSIEKKIELKRRKLPAYADYIASVLAAAAETGKAVQDEVFVQLMIWAVDAGEYSLVLPMARHVIDFGLDMPERYNRTAAGFILEDVADAALKAASLKQTFPVDVLREIDDLTAAAPINDIVRAKMQKAIGLHLVAAANDLEPSADGPAGQKQAMQEEALACFRRALGLHDKSGVKKEIERLESALKKTETAGGNAGAHV